MIRVLANSTLSGGNVEMADGKRLPPRLSAAREGVFLYVCGRGVRCVAG